MIALGIGDLRHNPEAAWLNLHGEALMPGLLGAVYDPTCGKEEVLEERITLILKGTRVEIAAFMAKLEDQLALANRYTNEGVGVAHFLRIKQSEDVGFFSTRILNVHLAPKPNSLAYHSGGSLGVALIFTRPNHFDGEQIALPLSNVNGTGVTSGLSLSNHNDSAHDNFFCVDGDDVETDLPACIRLEVSNSNASGETKDMWIGSYQYNRFNTLPQLTYEGESGSGGTDVNDVDASGGIFKRLSWSTCAWTDLLSWALTSANLTRIQGRALMPILRFGNVHAYDDL